MKKTLFLITLTFLSINVINAQKNKETNLYCYKSYDDFFSNSKKYVGKVLKQKFEMCSYNCFNKFKCEDTIKKKIFDVDFGDSTGVIGVSYRYKNEKYIRENNKKDFYLYICGNKKIMVVYTTGLMTANYDSTGVFKDGVFMAGDRSWFYFVKDLDLKNYKIHFEDVIKDNNKLYEQFLAEKKEDKKLFARNHIEVYKKYIKLYCDEKK